MKNGFKINENTSGQKGQSTFEYILLFTAVVVVLVVFLKPGGYYQKTVEDTIDHGQNHLLNMANLIFTNQ